MTTVEILNDLQSEAFRNAQLRKALLDTRRADDPLVRFCEISRASGYDLYPMDVINAGEEFYASMRRSTNGGGENAPMLDGEDDFYELFLAALT